MSIWQLHAEKVKRIILLSEFPHARRTLPPGVRVLPRTELDTAQRELRAIPGVTALVYEQGCAAERRRLRKRKQYPDPAVRTYINPDVCEGCGDCGLKSGCVSLVPIETELGIKRAVDQESCNKDYTCVEGFCPSFVTVKGGTIRVSQIDAAMAEAAAAALAGHDAPFSPATGNLLIAGIGGTGTITLGATLARAALHEGKRVSTFDVTGLAQKNGPVYSHIRVIDGNDTSTHQPRIPVGQLDTLVGCDIASTAAPSVLPLVDANRTRVFANNHLVPVAAFQRNPDLRMSPDDYADVLAAAVPPPHMALFEAGSRVARVLGNGALMNIALLGYALQHGAVPIRAKSIEAAMNRGGKSDIGSIFAFRIGRLMAIDPHRAEALLGGELPAKPVPLAERVLEDIVSRARELLTRYQNRAYADRYESDVRTIESRDGRGELTRVYAANLFTLMRYKDEYEVARLYTQSAFIDGLRQDFTGAVTLNFNLAPPLLAWRKTATGEPRKIRFGPWVQILFKSLAPLKILRGTPFDPFGWSADRKLERELIAQYRGWIECLPSDLDEDEYETALKIAALPRMMKGYGPVKDRNVATARSSYRTLTAQKPRLAC